MLLTRIGLGMVWPEADAAERARLLTSIAQIYIAFGLIKTVPQIITLILPKEEQKFELT